MADHLRGVDPGADWVPQHKWHITLHFTGTDHPLPRVKQALQDLSLTSTPCPPVRLQGSGRFGNAVWMGVTSQESGTPWKPVADALKAALPRTGTPERYIPHLTVLWTEEPREDELADYVGDWWVPNNIEILNSVTGPPARFTVAGARALTGPDARSRRLGAARESVVRR